MKDDAICKGINYKETYTKLIGDIKMLRHRDLMVEKEKTINPIMALELNAKMQIVDYILEELLPFDIVYED